MHNLKVFFEDKSDGLVMTDCNYSFADTSKRLSSTHLYKSLAALQLELLLLLVDSKLDSIVRDHSNLFSKDVEVYNLCDAAVDALRNPTSSSDLGKFVARINEVSLKKGYTLTILRR